MGPVQVLIAFILAAVSYWWYKVKKQERQLKWITQVPGIPLIGNALDFGSSTETLNVLSRYLKQSDGLCVVNMATWKLIVASDYKFLEFILTSTKIVNKPTEYRYLHKWLGSGLLTATAPKWRKTRKIITPSFHFLILEQFVPILESNANTMVQLLKKETEKDSVDIYPYVTMCALDIICETAMGVSINAQINRSSDYVFAVKEMCRITMERSFSIIKMYDFLYPFSKDFYKEKKYVKTLHSYTNSVINSRREELKKESANESDKDEETLGVKKKFAFLDLLLQSTMDGQPLSHESIREEVDTFMFAGHDTTASAITFTLYCLAENPEIQEKAFEEQKAIFGTNQHRPVTHRDLQEMKYLELVIKETLRLFPSVPFIGRVTDKETVYKDDLVIPKGNSIVIFMYGANRNPKYFPEPDKFDPTRFERMNGTPPFAYIPFSAGPRNCIGQKFAMLEVKSTVSKILRNYVLSQTTPKHVPVLAAETVLISKNGIKIKLRNRNWEEHL